MMGLNSAWYRPSVADLDRYPAPDGEEQRTMTRHYLQSLAERRGIAIPSGATYDASGILDGKTVVLRMPGFMADNVVTVEEVDDAGEVRRSTRLPLKVNASIPWNAAKVREVCALPKVAKRAAQPKPKIIAECQPAQPSETVEKIDMHETDRARLDRLEETMGAIAAALAALTGAGAAIAAQVALEADPSDNALHGPENASVSFLDLVGESVPAPVEVIDAPADTVSRADYDRLMRAYQAMRAGRKALGRAKGRADRHAADALATAHMAKAAQASAEERASKAEAYAAQLKPLADVLNAMRGQDYVPSDPSGVVEGQRVRRWPTKENPKVTA